MRAEAVVPVNIVFGLPDKLLTPQRHDGPPEAFIFHGQDKPFDDGDAAVLVDRAESRPDLATPAPAFEGHAPELAALVADDISWQGFGLANSFGQKIPDLPAVWLLAEDGYAHNLPGKMIDDRGDPPAERKALRQGERQPGCPEAADGHGSQIDVPDVVGIVGSNDAV